jgi:hypothetical protein
MAQSAFKLQDFINTATDCLTENQYLQSPIWTALIIVVILILTVWYVMHSEVDTIYEDTSMLHMYFKIGLLMMIGGMLVLFLHDRSVGKYYSKKAESTGQHDIMERLSREDISKIKEIIKTKETEKK